MKSLLAISLLLSAIATLPAAIPGADSLAQLIVAEFDTNSDGVLDSGEWQGGIKKAFAKLDANGDGSIAPGEIEELGGEIAQQTGELTGGLIVAIIKRVLLTLDTDGDKLVSRKEYEALSEVMFVRLDADKTATLSIAELSEIPVKLIAK
jgi:hypothetical protein